jgi:hypothetical protein
VELKNEALVTKRRKAMRKFLFSALVAVGLALPLAALKSDASVSTQAATAIATTATGQVIYGGYSPYYYPYPYTNYHYGPYYSPYYSGYWGGRWGWGGGRWGGRRWR